MNTTTKTSDQIAADFEAVFKDVKAAPRGRRSTQVDRLEPYRKEILKQHRRGLSWKQIAAGMADPRIAQKVSVKTLRKAFQEKAAESAAKPARERLILDPLTGQRVSPAPATMPARQRLILDPATGQPVTASPAPSPARQRLILDPATGKPITPA